ncbi:metallophosphoesterase [Haloarchaeobius sp. FL176]|uniref:metallophosphoesterase n=1 Tax=Haloarchaeobius sp. FL176 TaxID=2967129 RepID=UPI0021481D8D|nr:metallophosphoesterase [Haloarchaeobius sp. FL176]
MASVEPVPGRPAAVVDTGIERTLVVADFHAGIEAGLRVESGVHVASRAEERREVVHTMLDSTDPDRFVVLGDFMHSIGSPGGAERGEVEVLLEAIDVPTTVVKGNHDGDIESWVDAAVTDGTGVRLGDIGFAHGHTWPDPAVLAADIVCIGHEHPCVRLTDEVGGSRIERGWLRGSLEREPFTERELDQDWSEPELVVFPAFNDLCGGTWVNVNENFLAPFLPEALPSAQAYLLDGTRLGDYGRV